MNTRLQRLEPGKPQAVARGAFWALALWGLSLALAPPALATGQVGEPAADFTLHDTEGTIHTLSDYQGRVVVLFMMGYG